MPSSTFRWATRWLVVLFCLLSSTLVLAQSTGGRILGRVADPTGAVLANVKVTLANEATGISRDAQTNNSGDYVFVEVQPATYELDFEQSGFKKNVRKSVTVEVNQFVTLPAVQPTPDSIQEFRVLTNTFDAEYGRNSGAVVNVITKSGTNAYHGNVYEFFRNRVLNAKNYFESDKGDFKQNQFGGTLGGPIKKNHTFFFT